MINNTTQELSDTSKQKVCLIKDISNLSRYLYQDPIVSAEAFDILYDMHIKDLESLERYLISVAEFRRQASSLANLVHEINRNARKNNEEGD